VVIVWRVQRMSRMSPVPRATGSRSPAAALDRAASTDSVLVRSHIVAEVRIHLIMITSR